MKFKEANILVQYILKSKHSFNEWEEAFLSAIINEQRDLTNKQAKALQGIYTRAVGGGNYQKRHFV